MSNQSQQQVGCYFNDPYAATPTIRPLPERRWDPLDRRERYHKEVRFEHSPSFQPLPATGSLNLRSGKYDRQPMTAYDKRFEKYANEMQALHDIRAEIREWERCRDVEEEAITRYDEFGRNLNAFLLHIKTYDQAELEKQCKRKKDKEKVLSERYRMDEERAAAARYKAAKEQTRREQAAAKLKAAVRQETAARQEAAMQEAAGRADFTIKILEISPKAKVQHDPSMAGSRQASPAESTTPGTSPQSPGTLTHDEDLERRFDANPNVPVRDSRRFIDISQEELYECQAMLISMAEMAAHDDRDNRFARIRMEEERARVIRCLIKVL